MAHYIDRDAVMAEIDKRINTCLNQREEMIIADCETLVGDATARAGELKCLRDFIESLEVKGVDLEKALSDLDKDIKEFVTTEEFENESTTAGHYWVIAKHAFLLGLKV